MSAHIATAQELRSEIFTAEDSYGPVVTNVPVAESQIARARQAHMDSASAILEGTRGALSAGEQRSYNSHLDEVNLLDLLAAEVRQHRVEIDPIVNPGYSSEKPENRTFTAFLRGEPQAETELRAQGVATGAAGGYLVPQGFREKLVETLKRTGGVRQVAEIITTDTGNPLPWPTNNDTANVGSILAENTAATEQDATVGQAQLGAYTYTSKIVRVSLQLLQDSGFDIDSWLARALAMRVARAQNQHFTTGTGSSQPQGMQTNAAVGKTGAAGQVASVTYDDLVDLIHSVDPAYREDEEAVAWMMADTTFGSVRKLKDTQGRPLVEPDVKAGAPNTLLGYRVVINNDMPQMAANAKSILFGNFRAGYVIRDAMDFEVLRMVERYGEYLQVGFLGYQRSDGTQQDAAAYKAYAHPAI
jgi:HK97 family phage major capsid protein